MHVLSRNVVSLTTFYLVVCDQSLIRSYKLRNGRIVVPAPFSTHSGKEQFDAVRRKLVVRVEVMEWSSVRQE